MTTPFLHVVLNALQLPDGAAAVRPKVAADHALTVGGWIFLILSVVFVWVLTFWCFKRVLTAPEANEAAPPAGFGP